MPSAFILLPNPANPFSFFKNVNNGNACSPLEVEIVKKVCGEDFQTVTPGIRFATDSKGDQKRVTTPAIAHQLGSDYIVVGRSITRAENPVAVFTIITTLPS